MSPEEYIASLINKRYAVEVYTIVDRATWLDGPTPAVVAAGLSLDGHPVSDVFTESFNVTYNLSHDVPASRQVRSRTAIVALVRAMRAGLDPAEAFEHKYSTTHPAGLFPTNLVGRDELPVDGLQPDGPVEQIAVTLIEDHYTGPRRCGEYDIIRLCQQVAAIGGRALLDTAEKLAS